MILNRNRIMDDHSNWRKSSRVVDYLNHIDKIPHRTEGDFYYVNLFQKKQVEFLI